MAFAGFFLHELGHWSMGEALGYNMQMALNGVSPVDRAAQVAPMDAISIKAAGPAVTIILAAFALVVVRVSAVLAFAIAFFSLHMRITAYAISLFINPNDEASIGLELGVGPHFIHLIVIAALWILALIVGRRAHAGWLAWIIAFITSSAIIALVVMFLDPMLGRIL